MHKHLNFHATLGRSWQLDIQKIAVTYRSGCLMISGQETKYLPRLKHLPKFLQGK